MRFPCRSASILPNVTRQPFVRAQNTLDSPDSVLIVGSMWYEPNREGVNWFVRDCWPAVAKRCPSLTLRIVGAARSEDRERWQKETRTEAPGFVSDLSYEYERALFAVAPIRFGGGTCIKLLEAAAHRKPCVATDFVHKGFAPDFPDGDAVLVARNADQMVRACIQLFDDAALRAAISRKASEVVAHSYSETRFESLVRVAASKYLGSRT